MKKILFVVLFVANVIFVAAQQHPKVKYGDVKIEDFKKNLYEIDSSAEAVVLYDYCVVKYEGNNKSDFNVVYKYHKRIRLLNKNAFDLATVSIPLYKSSSSNYEERIEKLEAATYNIDNAKVDKQKIDKSALFKDKYNKNYTIQKFTLPNIKEGCIIEYTYTVSSPFSHTLKEWNFQDKYPVLWSEYDVTIPSIFVFVLLKHGYTKYAIEKTDVSSDTYNILIEGDAGDRSAVANFRTATFHSIWAKENLPALKEEPFTTTLENHRDKVEFQISSLRYPNSPEKPLLRTWVQVATDLMKDESFGADVNAKNGWMSDELKKITTNMSTPLEKAKKIFEFVRDNFACTDNTALYLSNSIKKTFQNKNGNVADINLLLTALLKHENIDANPVLISTKENGKPYETYPILSQYNYVISRIIIDTTEYLLDASNAKMGFNKLPEKCYNLSGRLIDNVPVIIPLSSNSLKESKVTSVQISSADDGTFKGIFMSNLGYFESTQLREQLSSSTNDEFFKNIKKSFAFDVEISNGNLENAKLYDENITEQYEFKTNAITDEIIYFNPMLTEAYKTNPFKAANRFYPVEMPYTSSEVYIFSMDIPKGYKVDEMPKSVKVKLNEDDGNFEYLVNNTGNKVQLKCIIKINKAFFAADEYENLRNFYAYIVKKQSEQFVFKKVK